MTDANRAADPAEMNDTPPDGVDLHRTPLAGNPFNPAASGYDPSAFRVDLYGNRVDRNPYFPDPNNPNLDMGQVLYHMAFGAKPEDFHPFLRPLAHGFSIAFQPQPKVPGLLGSLEVIRAAAQASPPEDFPSAGEEGEDAGSDDAEVTPAAVGQGQRLSTTYPRTLDPTVERHVAEYNQTHGLKPGDREYLDPDIIKAMIRQEAGHDYDALLRDPMQVNGPDGDWDKHKFRLGLRRGVAPGADLSVKAGIQWLRRKAYEHDGRGNESRFRGWPQAVQRYNGRLPDYSDQVWDHLGEIKGGF